MARKLPSKSQARTDEWASALTGIGTTRDRRTSYGFRRSVPLDPQLLEDLYDGNDLAAWVCDAYAEEALREGFELAIPDDTDTASKVIDRLEDLDALTALTDALVDAAKLGNAGVYVGVNDDQEMPLDFATIKQIEWLKVVTRRDLAPIKWYSDPNSGKYGTPEMYVFTPVTGGATSSAGIVPKVHESRIVMFDGTRTSTRSKQGNAGWAFSKLQRVMHVIQNFDVAWEGASYMLGDASQGVFKLSGLLNMLASIEGRKLLERRMEVVERTRGIARAIAVDPEKGEDFTKVATVFTGIPDMLDRFADRLAAASRMPVTILLGKSPAGLNATGASDLQIWYDRIRAFQRQEVKPALELLVTAVLSELGASPKSWSISFPELQRMSPLEEADLRNKQANTDKLYVDAEIATPEEIAVSRFTDKGWSPETQIDLDVRQAILDTPEEEQPDNSDAGTIGARAKALQDLLTAVATEKLPVDSGRAILINVFGMTADVADEVIGKIGTSFKIKEPAPLPGGVGPDGKPIPGARPAPARPGAPPTRPAPNAAPRGARQPRPVPK